MSYNERRGSQLVAAAAQFLGVRFQLFGRDPVQGLDCIGLITCSLRAIGRDPVLPSGYRLRNSDPSRWFKCATASGLVICAGPIESGDVLLLNPGPGQHHLVIAENADLAIHAHAGLRRIVRQPMALAENGLARWRLP